METRRLSCWSWRFTESITHIYHILSNIYSQLPGFSSHTHTNNLKHQTLQLNQHVCETLSTKEEYYNLQEEKMTAGLLCSVLAIPIKQQFNVCHFLGLKSHCNISPFGETCVFRFLSEMKKNVTSVPLSAEVESPGEAAQYGAVT